MFNRPKKNKIPSKVEPITDKDMPKNQELLPEMEWLANRLIIANNLILLSIIKMVILLNKNPQIIILSLIPLISINKLSEVELRIKEIKCIMPTHLKFIKIKPLTKILII